MPLNGWVIQIFRGFRQKVGGNFEGEKEKIKTPIGGTNPRAVYLDDFKLNLHDIEFDVKLEINKETTHIVFLFDVKEDNYIFKIEKTINENQLQKKSLK